MASWDSGLTVAAVGRAYEAVAASQTAQAMGATGAKGDDIDMVWIFPVTTTPGTVTIADDATTIWSMTGVTLSDLRPIPVPLNLRSINGAWKITTGANVSVLASGRFT